MLKTGNLIKEKREYLVEWFTTSQGLFDFFIATAIWGFLLTKYNQAVFDYIFNLFSSVTMEVFHLYLAYLGLGFFYAMLGLGISFFINFMYHIIFNR